MSNTIPDYPLDYKEACFYAWYRAGRPVANRVREVLPAHNGQRPSMVTVSKWMKGGDGWLSWHEHADILDAEVSLKLDKEAIQERAKLLKKLAHDGRTLKEKGMKALEGENPFSEDMPSAVRAITSGIEIEFKYSGMAEAFLQISQMSDKQLEKEALRLLGKNENVEIIDGETTSEEDGDSNPEDDLS